MYQFTGNHKKHSRRIFTAVQIIISAIFAHEMAPKLSDFPSFAPVAMLWLINWSSALSILLSSFFSDDSLADCFYKACQIYHFSKTNLNPLSLKLFLFMTLYPFAQFIYASVYIGIYSSKIITRFFIFNFAYIPTGMVAALVSTYCIIAQNAYHNINVRLSCFLKKRILSNISLTVDQLEHYLEVTKFTSGFAKCFGIFFLIIFLSFTFRLIIYTLLVVKLRRIGHFHDFLACAVHTFYFIFWLLFLCYRCNTVQREVRIFHTCTF